MLAHQAGDVVVVQDRPLQLLRLLGRGGQGSVYEARDFDGRRVAVKLVPAHGRHRNEVRILASLQSDHVVQFIRVGISRDVLIVVMELIDGVDLKALVQLCRQEQRHLPPALVLQLISQATLGLLEATRHGGLAFHRDVKPGNLILSRQGVVKLIDFGIAHQVQMEYTGSLVGTPENMAPEQVGLEPAWKVDVRTDLYCLGLVCYELLTLETLHIFPADMPVPERLRQVWEGETRARLKPVYAQHPALGALLKKCLERDPAQRFQTLDELLVALFRTLERLPQAPELAVFADRVWRLARQDDHADDLDLYLIPARCDPTLSLSVPVPLDSPGMASPHPARSSGQVVSPRRKSSPGHLAPRGHHLSGNRLSSRRWLPVALGVFLLLGLATLLAWLV